MYLIIFIYITITVIHLYTVRGRKFMNRSTRNIVKYLNVNKYNLVTFYNICIAYFERFLYFTSDL